MTEMSKGFLEDRKDALEDAFFAARDRELRLRLRERSEKAQHRAALAEVCGIRDERVLDQFVDLGIHADTAAALSILPLVAVAWADGRLDDREREAVLKASREHGITDDDHAHELLEAWLAHSPPEKAVLTAWKQYIRAIAGTMSREQLEALHRDTIGGAMQVAEAAGGFLGIASVSAREREVIEDLEAAFTQA